MVIKNLLPPKDTRLSFTICAFLILVHLNVKSQVPHLTGTIKVSVTKGTLECNLTLTNVPAISNYSILLNSGLNVQYFRDSSNRINYDFDKVYDPNTSEESFQYYLPELYSGKQIPTSFKIKYTGAYPIVNDTNYMYDLHDWKGNIADNGTTIRATEQSAWYPIIYDNTHQLLIDNYTYELTVSCDDGDCIYMNGDAPKIGKVNRFHSNTPFPMLLFAGKYKFKNLDSINFVNIGLSNQKLALLSRRTRDIIDFYERKLKAPYKSIVTYVASSPTSKSNGFLFVTFPTIMVIGGKEWNIDNLFIQSPNLVIDTTYGAFISHELGHYYFGTLFRTNSDLKIIMQEGFTEYLSLQYIRNLYGEKYYQKKLSTYREEVKQFTNIPTLDKVKETDLLKRENHSLAEKYRYRYLPLLLSAIEKEIGIDGMWRWISLIINDKNVITNYDYFKSSLLRSGLSVEKVDLIEKKCVQVPL